MKNNYEKAINEVIELKEKVYEDFKKSGYKSFCEFIKDDLKDFKKDMPGDKKAA
ncbi:MAG TPA: hypothetical protein PKK26_19415 [Candidatus Wallbacteria bacterium]|nr:hypothetical protein [Candidatus Wallbacteria bacterium]